jgi:RNA polymerase sigma factor (sigma-70 family)
MTPTKTARRSADGGAHQRPPDITRLVRRAGTGDQEAWNDLIDQYSGLVWAIARGHRLGAADAADAFQSTWLRLVEHLGDLTDPERVGAWLATTAKRECLRLLRSSGRQIPVGDGLPEVAADGPEPYADLLRAERDAILWRAFERLRARDQALLRMLVADPAPSYREISTALEMPVGSIGPTRGRCLERLQREHELVADGR